MIIYQGRTSPLLSRFDNNLELMNEWFVCMSTLHLCFYTDFIPDPELQYSLGWSLNGFTLVMITYNLAIIIYFLVNNLRLIYIKYKKLWHHKFFGQQEDLEDSSSDEEVKQETNLNAAIVGEPQPEDMEE